MRAVVHAELTEGVPRMLDMTPVPSTFARRRRVDLFQCALTLRQNARRRARLYRAPLANAFEPDDRCCIVTLTRVC